MAPIVAVSEVGLGLGLASIALGILNLVHNLRWRRQRDAVRREGERENGNRDDQGS